MNRKQQKNKTVKIFSSKDKKTTEKITTTNINININAKKPSHKKTKSLFLNKQEKINNVDKDNAPPSIEPLNEINLKETLSIITEIQSQFESSVKENKKPVEEIERLIDNKLTLDSYIALSSLQKENISTDIERSSVLRIQNYESPFHYIQVGIEGIQECLEDIMTKEDSEDFTIDNKDDDTIISNNTSHVVQYSDEHANTEECPMMQEEDTDFSERAMLDNAFVIPPKNSPFNYQNVKDFTRTRSKRFDVLKQQKSLKKRKSKDDSEITQHIILDLLKDIKIPDEYIHPSNNKDENCLII